MFFVGREKETTKIIHRLQQGRNVILTGKFGIGRTTLMKHVAALNKDRWRVIFVDFSQTPGHVIKQLSAILAPENESKRGGHDLSYKSGRSLVVRTVSKDKRSPVLVLDNIAKVTVQRLRLIRFLALESRFQFVAIIESFLPEKDRFLLRALLVTEEVIILPNLSIKSTKELLRYLAESHTLDWTEQHLDMLVSLNRGYPLGVHEIIQQELEARRKDGFRR